MRVLALEVVNFVSTEIGRTLSFIPPMMLSGRMAWRLHPEDFEKLLDGMKELCGQQQPNQSFMPTGRLHVNGIVIVIDEEAPRL